MGIIRVKRSSKSWSWQPRLEALESRRLLSARVDFNGDGYDDLAIGAPGENNSAGMVHILYGSDHNGLTSSGSQTFTQSSLGTDSSEAGDRFGSSLAAGDFNNDGRDDLAVGIPGEDIGAVSDAGAVSIIFGSPNGLTGAFDQFWHQDSVGVPGLAEAGDQFGYSLATGDFNGEDFNGNSMCDLAVGVVGENLGSVVDAGIVQIFLGWNNGFTYGITPRDYFSQDTIGVPGSIQAYDRFGTSLASADFNADGKSDLAVGVPQDNYAQLDNAGAVNLLYGADAGLTATGSLIWNAPSPSTNAYAGWSLAAGYLNDNPYGDLVIGSPIDNSGDGTVFVDYDFNLAGDLHELGSYSGGYYGWSVALATFASDAYENAFVAGMPFADDGSVNDAGAVDGPEGELFPEDMGGISEPADHFGWAVATGDFYGDGIDLVVVGVPDEDFGSYIPNAGTILICQAYELDGYACLSSEEWNQNSIGVDDIPEPGDQFGYAFAVGADVPGGGTGPSGGGGGGRPMSADILIALGEEPSTQTTPDVPASRLVATVRPTAESESDSERTRDVSVERPSARAIRQTPTPRVLDGILSHYSMFANEVSGS